VTADLEVLLSDVVARLKALGASRANQDAVQRSVADSRECVLVADGSGRIVAASNGALRLLGYALPELTRLEVGDLTADVDQPVVDPLWEEFLRHRRQTGHYALRCRHGAVVFTRYAARANVIRDLSVAVHQRAE
jgi:PAS domain S-box-containing protein